MLIDGSPVDLTAFLRAMMAVGPLEIAPEVVQRISAAHREVEDVAAGSLPVYGLNTGLGANLGHRIAPEDIPRFQLQIVAGRAMACGDPLPEAVGRGVLLARIISAATGHSGISPGLFAHLCDLYLSGLSPLIPEFGSIGASDLLQNATLGMAVCGQGKVWDQGEIREASLAFEDHGLSAPDLRPKDGLALISHSGVSVALSAIALADASKAMRAFKAASVLSFEGYRANAQIFSRDINVLRVSPGQSDMAAWFRNALKGSTTEPRRIQDALSFRTMAPVFGASEDALDRAISVFENELNGSQDSPVVMPDGVVQSTPNFLTPGLALALESAALSLVGVAQSTVQRMQRMMTPELSGLPRYLSPEGQASAGFVPSQKAAASLYAEIKMAAQPAFPDAAPVSDGVEDIGATTPQSALKLRRQARPAILLAGLEAIVASQAIDLADAETMGPYARRVHRALRQRVPFGTTDRAWGDDVERAVEALAEVTD